MRSCRRRRRSTSWAGRPISTTQAAREGRALGPALPALLRRVEAVVVFVSAADGRADRGELRGGGLAQERDGGDADHRDQGDEQRVLDEAGALLGAAETGPQVGSAVLLPVGNE